MATSGETDVFNYGAERQNEMAKPGFFSVDYKCRRSELGNSGNIQLQQFVNSKNQSGF
jgi:hypothetical protein